jgi:hypothetical protein
MFTSALPFTRSQSNCGYIVSAILSMLANVLTDQGNGIFLSSRFL